MGDGGETQVQDRRGPTRDPKGKRSNVRKRKKKKQGAELGKNKTGGKCTRPGSRSESG